MKRRFSLYISKECQELWEDFVDLAWRRRMRVSTLLFEAIREYMERHAKTSR